MNEHKLHECGPECDNAHCRYCRGNLAYCTVCNGAEADLPTCCPGKPLSTLERQRIQTGLLDFIGDKWITNNARGLADARVAYTKQRAVDTAGRMLADAGNEARILQEQAQTAERALKLACKELAVAETTRRSKAGTITPDVSIEQLSHAYVRQFLNQASALPVHFELDGIRRSDGSVELQGVSICSGADPDRPVYDVTPGKK